MELDRLSEVELAGQPIPSANAFTGMLVGHFQDTNPSATAANFSGQVFIDWGDCGGNGSPGACGLTTDPGTPLDSDCSGAFASPCDPLQSQFDVTGTHTYTALATFTVTIYVGGSPVMTTDLQVNSILAGAFSAQISPPDSLITAGSSVDLLLTLTPNVTGGYAFPVQLGCTGLGPGMSCSFNPSSIVPDVTVVRQVHVLVNTTGGVAMQSAPPLPGRSGPAQLALLLPAFFGTFGLVLLTPKSRKDKRRAILWWGASLLLLALLLMGCGGGTALTGGGPGAGSTPPGTYNITVTMNVAGVTQPIAHIQVVR